MVIERGIAFFDGDWQVEEAGRDMPLGYWKPRDGSAEEMARAKAKALLFLSDLYFWDARGRPDDNSRPAATDAKYA